MARSSSSSPLHCVAIDFGATSGRVILGTWAHDRLRIKIIHRFAHAITTLAGHDYWERGTLWHQALAGLKAAERRTLA